MTVFPKMDVGPVVSVSQVLIICISQKVKKGPFLPPPPTLLPPDLETTESPGSKTKDQ
jgi:hypothetical protein